MLFTLFYFILALLLLIIVHESGHFLVARWCGVKVLRFSFGFGKVLASWSDKRGTEYTWSLFPFGGYVKMLGEDGSEVSSYEQHQSFNHKSLLVRAAIVFAGPLFNFLFAFILFWLVLVLGIQSFAPLIGKIQTNSIAARAGLTARQEILSLNGKAIQSWHDFQYAMLPLIGTKKTVELVVKSLDDTNKKTVWLPLTHWTLDNAHPDVLASFGIEPFIPIIPPIVGEVIAKSPASTAGLMVGDTITAIDKTPLSDWLVLVDYVSKHPDQPLLLTINRHGQIKTLDMQIGHIKNNGKTSGFLGLRSQRVTWPNDWLRIQREAPLAAIKKAFKQTITLTRATFVMMGRLVTGDLSLRSISGPVGIAQGAGESARGGIAYYLSFLALVSIGLGALNLLPIPMLDGGHLFYYAVEFVSRRSLSVRVKSWGIFIGISFLLALTMIALKNDLARLIS